MSRKPSPNSSPLPFVSASLKPEMADKDTGPFPKSVPVIKFGGRGSPLTPPSVFAIANGLAEVHIDSSASARLASFDQISSSDKVQVSISKQLTTEEFRASLAVLLNKLILSGTARNSVIYLVANTLNKKLEDVKLVEIDVTVEEKFVMEKSGASLVGICALLDHQFSALSTIAGAVAALSCEALKANLSAFNLMDSGDGSTLKDEIGVASDLKVLLNGSKLVGKGEYGPVSEIPSIHGRLREVVRSVHSWVRVELNSVVKIGKSEPGKAVATLVLPVAATLRYLGRNTLHRVNLVLNLVDSDELRTMFDRECPNFSTLKKIYNSILLAELDENYERLLHEVNVMLEMVRNIIAWEAIVAYLRLEGASEKGQSTEANGGNEKLEKKTENKNKNKKVALGRGTADLMQFFKDKMTGGANNFADSNLLRELVKGFYAVLDPMVLEFDHLVQKVKKIVDSNESRRLPKLPKGTRDFAKEKMAVRERAFFIIANVFKRHGATALDTPVFELRETLMGKYGEESKLIYDLADQGGELCSLRYDLTVPFARYVAMNGLTSFKRYHIGKVYRRDNPSNGRYREFYQCDFDIAGRYEVMGPDFEVIKILTELLDELDIGDYEVKLNHRRLLDGLLDICGVPPDKFRTICSSIDKLDKQSFEQIKKEMVEEKGLTVETAEKIGSFVKERGLPLELLAKLKLEKRKLLENEESFIALDELEILFKALEKAKCIGKVVFDLSLARGLDYYTGVIYEAIFKGSVQVGSIAAGGRYDNLIGMFGSKPVPAIGVSLGIERVITIMEQLQKDRNQVARAMETQVLVSILGDDLGQAAELVSELWDGKLKAEYMINKRIMKHIDRAKESRIPWMVIVGEREISEGIVKLKDIEAAVEYVVPRNKIVEELQTRLNLNSGR